jgi:putative ABC transport system permease protein
MGRLQDAFVAAEVAFAFTLLVGAALMLRSLAGLNHVDAGFSARQVLTMKLLLPESRYGSRRQMVNFVEQALQRMTALPGVRVAAVTTTLPLEGSAIALGYSLPDQPTPTGPNKPTAGLDIVSPGYLQALSMRLISGRQLSAGDRADSPPVVLVNQKMARRCWPGQNAIGRPLRIDVPGQPVREVVGVVNDIRHESLAGDATPEIYVPFGQWAQGSFRLVLKAEVPPRQLVAGAKQAIFSLDPDLPVSGVATLAELRAASIGRERFTSLLLACFAAIGLLLAVTGVYSVMAYAVAGQTREIGIRMALGADRAKVSRRILAHALAVTLAGLALGLALSFSLNRFLASQLFGVAALDGASLAAAFSLLLALGLLASYLPARRAAAVDPILALRYE